MPRRLGLGPVFVFESLINARRWQIYAGRSIFVLILLLGLVLVWTSTVHNANSWSLIQRLSEVGESFFYTIATVELFLVLLAAPGATAGAICLDRARGTLTHMMVTDLSDAEIVLGKLAARLAPVFGLLLCGLPVMALATLLGGIDPVALTGSVVVALAIAVLGCALALAVSVRASKAHEVLMVVYMLWAAWLLAVPIWLLLNDVFGMPAIPDWFYEANPFVLVFAPYTNPGYVGAGDFAAFIGAVLGLSAVLVGWTIFTLRRSIAWQEGRALRTRRGFRLQSWLPGPSLDFNPVLWRECRRGRSSKLTRFVWGVYLVGALGSTAMFTEQLLVKPFGNVSDMFALNTGMQIAFGLLMVSALAPTALTEERVRGSLDVLLATPIPTPAIVLAKWWGAYRVVPLLAVLPVLSMAVLACVAPTQPISFIGPVTSPPVPITLLDRVLVVAFTGGQVLLYGAAVVSLGLALATWFKRPARAIATNVTVFILMTIGWPFLAELGVAEFFMSPQFDPAVEYCIMLGTLSLSPLVGPVASSTGLEMNFRSNFRFGLWLFESVWLLAALVLAAGLLAVTVMTFDRCLGRVSERASRRPTPPGRERLKPAAPTTKECQMTNA